MEWAKHRKTLDILARKGRDMKVLKNWPKLAGHLQFAWQAFNELHRARQVSFDVCPLQVADVNAWMDLNQVDPEERRELFLQITVLDDEWLGHIRMKQISAEEEKEKEKEKAKGKVKGKG